MGRWLVRVLCGACLLLAVGVGVLWVRSHQGRSNSFGTMWQGDWHTWGDKDREYLEVASAEGFLAAQYEKFQSGDYLTQPLVFEVPPFGRGWGFAAERHRRDLYVFISFPHWFASLVCMLLPVGATIAWLVRRQRRRRRPLGLCETCGYDLRGSPERCPECGTVRKVHEGG